MRVWGSRILLGFLVLITITAISGPHVGSDAITVDAPDFMVLAVRHNEGDKQAAAAPQTTQSDAPAESSASWLHMVNNPHIRVAELTWAEHYSLVVNINRVLGRRGWTRRWWRIEVRVGWLTQILRYLLVGWIVICKIWRFVGRR